MKKSFVTVAVAVFTLAMVALSFAAGSGKMELKSGDESYVCNCGEKCACDTMSRNKGNCTCGKEMVKAKATKVESGKAVEKSDGWAKERTFKTNGQYTCACGPECKCDTISQNPGKCTCGKEMKKVGAQKS